MEHAQGQLRETRKTLAEVATQAGFETQSHFTSVFRRLVGTTPKRYREMHRVAPAEGNGLQEPNQVTDQQKPATAA